MHLITEGLMRFFAVMICALGMGLTSASADIVRLKSAHGVAETIDRLEAAVKGAGAKVFARIDHAKGAASVGKKLVPATVLIFGNPKLGTPALQGKISMGLDLPLRVLAYRDGEDVWVIYHAPADVARMHGLPAAHPVVGKMTGALMKLTGKAIGK